MKNILLIIIINISLASFNLWAEEIILQPGSEGIDAWISSRADLLDTNFGDSFKNKCK